MLAPTKLQDGDKIYHVGDTITFSAGLRLFGNVASSTLAAVAIQLPIKIGSDVNSFTIENPSTNSLNTYGGANVFSLKPIVNNTNIYANGNIANRDYGLLSVLIHFPTWSAYSAQVMCYLYLTGNGTTTITFGS